MGLREMLSEIPPWGRWLLVVTVLRFLVAAIAPITPEEAYHWTFAQHLDWGYLDHPPMIAWSIAASCGLFGSSTLAVRFVPILFATGTCALLAQLARRLYSERAASVAVILFSAQPAAFAIGMAGFPDSPLLFFWALSLVLVVRALETGRGGWWVAAGASLGAAMLSKYTAVFLAAGVVAHVTLPTRERRWLATPWPYLGLLAAVLVFSPVIAWNAAHDWASFRHQSVDRLQQANEVNLRMGAKAAAQFWLGMLPLTLPLAAIAIVRSGRSARPEERLLCWSCVPMMAFFLAIGFARSTHVLWPLPAYAMLAVPMAGAADAGAGAIARFYARRIRWVAGLSVVAFLAGAAHLAVILPGVPPVRVLYGWAEAAERARQIHEHLPPGSVYIGAGRKYLCAGELAFHLGGSEPVCGKHLLGGDGLQFAYWCAPRDVIGCDAVVVIPGDDASCAARLTKYFRSVDLAATLDVPIGRGAPVRFAIYVGRGYGLAARTACGRPH